MTDSIHLYPRKIALIKDGIPSVYREYSKNGSVSIGGRNWFYFLKGREEALYSSSDVDDNYLTVCYQPLKDKFRKGDDVRRLYAKFISPADFFCWRSNIDSQEWTFHECIVGSQKARFDIDQLDPKTVTKEVMVHAGFDEDKLSTSILRKIGEQVATAVVNATKHLLESLGLEVDVARDFTICSSHSKTKRSYHLICNGFYHHSHQDAKYFCSKVIEILCSRGKQWMVDFIDQGIYSSCRNLRMLGSTKPEEKRFKVIDKMWPIVMDVISNDKDVNELRLLERTLVTFISASTWIPLVAPENKIEFISEKSGEDVRRALELLQEKIPDHNTVYKGSSGGIITLERQSPGHCPTCNREHENENPYLLITEEGMVIWHCRRSRKGTVLGSCSSHHTLSPDNISREKKQVARGLPHVIKKVTPSTYGTVNSEAYQKYN